MVDSSERTVTPVNEVSSPSPLVMRLDRRRTELLGAIDLRRIQSRTIRLPDWFARRFALLDRLQNRYSSRDREASGTELIFPMSSTTSSTVASQEPLEGKTHPWSTSASTVMAQPVWQSTASADSESRSSPQYRVSRKSVFFSQPIFSSPSPQSTRESDRKCIGATLPTVNLD
jgi:hypothetical protein